MRGSLQSLVHVRYGNLQWETWKPVSRYTRCTPSVFRTSAMNKSAVLITGGPTVIGSAAAVAFAKKDARVVAAGRRDEAGKALVKKLRRFGSAAEFINADVLREDDVRALVDEPVARFGRLDVAVNNTEPKARLARSPNRQRRAMPRRSTRSVALEIVKSRNPCERRRAWSCGHGHVDPFYGHAGEQSGSGDGCADGSPRPSPRSRPTRSCSSRRTQLRLSPATSSMSTAVTARTYPVRATEIAQGSRLLRPYPINARYIPNGRKKSSG
jgi:short chain dehydrogenase